MGPAAQALDTTIYAPARTGSAAVALGLVCALPALFWTAVLWLAGHACGMDLHVAPLALTAGAIMLFLALVIGALQTRARPV